MKDTSYLGRLCEVKLPDNELVTKGEITEFSESRLTLCSNRDAITSVQAGQPVKLSIPSGRVGFCVWEGTVQSVSERSIVVENLQMLSESDHRSHFRVDLRQSAVVRAVPEPLDSDLPPMHPVMVEILNLSISGLYFVAQHPINTQRRLKLSLMHLDFPEELEIKICRTRELRGGCTGYGAYFCNITQYDRDLLCRYILRKQGKRYCRIPI